MILVYKIALDPNDVQATYFAKAAGTARFAYNWALAEWRRQYEVGRSTSCPLKNRYLARSIAKMGSFEFRRHSLQGRAAGRTGHGRGAVLCQPQDVFRVGA